jgi:hypothetical protein
MRSAQLQACGASLLSACGLKDYRLARVREVVMMMRGLAGGVDDGLVLTGLPFQGNVRVGRKGLR